MKIPSRAKLEKDLARLKRAAERNARRSDPVPKSKPPLLSSLKSALQLGYDKIVEILQNLRTVPPRKILAADSRILTSHDIVRVIQVASDEPRFFTWFMYLRSLPPDKRTRELGKMSQAMRLDPENEDLAEILDNLHSAPVYESFCLVLEEERKNIA